MRRFLPIICLFAACASDTTGVTPIEYQITDVIAIDSLGRVLVMLDDTIKGRAAIWDNGQLVMMPQPGGSSVLYSVNDLSNAGTVTGAIRTSLQTVVPFIWREGTAALEVLSPPSDLEYLPRAMNDVGQIVGVALDPKEPDADRRFPFIWSAQTGFQKLLVPLTEATRRWSGATDINNAGQVVGWYSDCGGCIYIYGFSWLPGRGFTRIAGATTYPDEGETIPHAVNERGDVTGLNTDFDVTLRIGRNRAFFWSYAGAMFTVGPVGTYSCGFDINDVGQVVGETNSYGASHSAFVANVAGQVTQIPTGGTRSGAVAINNRGQVIGWWEDTLETHFFLWSPSAGLRELGRARPRVSAIRNANVQSTMSLPC